MYAGTAVTAGESEEWDQSCGKTAEGKGRLEWSDIPKDFEPESCELEWLQDDVE